MPSLSLFCQAFRHYMSYSEYLKDGSDFFGRYLDFFSPGASREYTPANQKQKLPWEDLLSKLK